MLGPAHGPDMCLGSFEHRAVFVYDGIEEPIMGQLGFVLSAKQCTIPTGP